MAPHELVLALAAVVAVAVLLPPPPGVAGENVTSPAPAGPTPSSEGRVDVSNQKLRCLYLPGVKSGTDTPPTTYIDATANLLTEVGDNALTGLFLLRYLNLSDNLLHEWGRYPFKDLRSLQLLDLSQNNFRNVDRVVLEPLQALRRLNLSRNRIQYLDAAAFPRLERLHDLDLTHNEMEVIADDAFVKLGALQRLDLRWNRLSTLGERTLRGLTAVQSVLLGGNLISEAVPGALQGLNSLSEISLADNGQVVDLVLVGNRLQRVDLSRIGLSAMPAALTRSVRALVLPGNNVRIISCGDLDSFPLLQALELSSNGLALVEDDALGRLEQLETLVLRNNSLMMIPPSLPESLVSLQLQHNQIRHIGANDLRGLRRLERLDLGTNQVHHIHDGAFRFLESLQELDLSGNKLVELRAASLAGPVGLRTLRLAHLAEITAPAKWLPFPIERPERLQSLDLDQSPQLARQLLADTAALMAMPHLQVLRLGSDELHHLRPDLSRLLSHLTHLRLADNPWHCAGLRWLPRWLQSLDTESATNATCRQPAEVAGLQLRNLTAAHFNASQLDDGDEEEPAPPLALPLAGPSPDEEVSIPINEYKRILIELNKTLAREAAAAADVSPVPISGLALPTAGQSEDAVNLTVPPVPVAGTEAPAPPPVAAALSALPVNGSVADETVAANTQPPSDGGTPPTTNTTGVPAAMPDSSTTSGVPTTKTASSTTTTSAIPTTTGVPTTPRPASSTTTGVPTTTLASDSTTGAPTTPPASSTTTGVPTMTLASDSTTGAPTTPPTTSTTTGVPTTTLASDSTTGAPTTPPATSTTTEVPVTSTAVENFTESVKDSLDKQRADENDNIVEDVGGVLGPMMHREQIQDKPVDASSQRQNANLLTTDSDTRPADTSAVPGSSTPPAAGAPIPTPTGNSAPANSAPAVMDAVMDAGSTSETTRTPAIPAHPSTTLVPPAPTAEESNKATTAKAAKTTPQGHGLRHGLVHGGEQMVASSLRHGASLTEGQPVNNAGEAYGMSRHTTSVVAMFAVAVCCSVAVLLAFAIARNSRHRRQQLLRLHSMEDLVLRGRGTDLSQGLGLVHRDQGPELW